MSAFFNPGETKIRPDVYNRYSTDKTVVTDGAMDGVCAIPIHASWGPVGVVTTHETKNSVLKTYGTDGTVDMALAMFDGGAAKVHICRLGGGESAAATLSLQNSEESPAVTLTAKYPGTFDLKVTISQKLGSETEKEMIVYNDSTVKEKITFSADSTNEPKNLEAAVNERSAYLTAKAEGDAGTTIKTVTQESLAGGVDPVPTTSDYANALDALEPFRYNVVALDVIDKDQSTISSVLHEYIKSVYETGKFIIGVVGDSTEMEFEDRAAKAAAFNDAKIVYCGTGYEASGVVVDGAKAVCKLAGAIAATPSNQSIVHTVIPGATNVIEYLKNEQYETAIQNGMVMTSMSADGQVWYDSGVNTLITPDETQDDGWKKIRRVKTRFEIMDRIDRALAPKIGKINCNPDGVADVIQTAQNVLNTMVAENKLADGAIIVEDPDNPYQADSAWFVITADDYDSLEKIYLHYQFRYSTNS